MNNCLFLHFGIFAQNIMRQKKIQHHIGAHKMLMKLTSLTQTLWGEKKVTKKCFRLC